MDSAYSRPLRPLPRSARFAIAPTRADLCIASAAAGLVALSLFPAYFDRPARGQFADPARSELADLPAPLDPVTTAGVTNIAGGAKRIDVGAALAARRAALGEETGIATPVSIAVHDIADLRQSSFEAHHPDPELVEETAYGVLPIRAADGRRPFDVYRGPSPSRAGPKIAIVVGGLGISQSGTQSAIAALPTSTTLAFAANGNSLDRWMQDARRTGHELLLQLPMEPVGYPTVDPGENTVTVEQMKAGDLSSLEASLARLTNYVGIANYLGGKLTADAAAMDPLMGELARRGLMYLDDGTSLRTVAPDIAAMTGTPIAAADLVLDDTQDPAEISRRLDQLEQIARARGSAIGTASAFETSVSVIVDWQREAERRGIELVPVSALARDPEGS